MVVYREVGIWKGRINLEFHLKEIVRNIQEGIIRICKKIKAIVLK